MIGAAGVRIWLATAAVDGRKGFDTLCRSCVRRWDTIHCAGICLSSEPLDGAVKILFWDSNGLVLYAKRLERGIFRWPQAGEASIALSGSSDGIAGRTGDRLCLGGGSGKNKMVEPFAGHDVSYCNVMDDAALLELPDDPIPRKRRSSGR